MKFKVGDRVIVYRNTSFSDGTNPGKGKVFTISYIYDDVYGYDDEHGTWSECNLKLYISPKRKKLSTIAKKAIRDAHGRFTSKKGLRRCKDCNELLGPLVFHVHDTIGGWKQISPKKEVKKIEKLERIEYVIWGDKMCNKVNEIIDYLNKEAHD